LHYWKPKDYAKIFENLDQKAQVIEEMIKENPAFMVNHYRKLWLLIELLVFYLNIIGMWVFVLLTRCTSFKTRKERAGYGVGKHRKIDFLTHCEDDIHWFTTEVIQLGLLFYVFGKAKAWSHYWSFAAIVIKRFINGVFCGVFYFRTGSYEMEGNCCLKNLAVIIRILWALGILGVLVYYATVHLEA